MQFLYWRHPKIRMGVELLIKPGRSAFVGSDAQKVRAWIACWRAFSILVGTHARFEWPSPTHVALFSVLHLKSKPVLEGCFKDPPLRTADTSCSQASQSDHKKRSK